MALSPLAAGLLARLDGVAWALEESTGTPADTANVFALEAVAKQKLDDDAYQFLASGSDDLLTLQANRDAFRRLRGAKPSGGHRADGGQPSTSAAASH